MFLPNLLFRKVTHKRAQNFHFWWHSGDMNRSSPARTKEAKTGQKSRTQGIFSPFLLDFVAPYWLSVLPP
jgi:hypothetical protein